MKRSEPEPVWTFTEVLEYLAEYCATVKVINGNPHLDLKEPVVDKWGQTVDRAETIGRVLPSLKVYRQQLVDLYKSGGEKKLTAFHERARIVAALAQRAFRTNKRLYWIEYEYGKLKSAPLKKTLPPEATLLCVAGDDKWTRLPAVVDPIEKKEKKRKKYKLRSRPQK